MRPAMLWITTALLSASAPASASEVFDAIDEAYESGKISAAERLIDRVMAVRAPERLPAKWRALVPHEVEARCHSEVLLEAFQQRPKLSPSDRTTLRELLDPPNDLAYFVE